VLRTVRGEKTTVQRERQCKRCRLRFKTVELRDEE
jgi:transcriptional regulator NrdR family protein